MRKMLLLLLFINSICLCGQEKHDFVWLLGANPNNPAQNLGGTKIDFNQTPFEVTYFDIPIDFFAIAMISDAEGNLLFYTNGCDIVNRNHSIMKNGESISPGQYHDNYCGSNVNIGYPLYQGTLAIPWPHHNGYYYLFHMRYEEDGFHSQILYSLINMTTPDGLGEVISKNQVVADTPVTDMFTAVRHGNGRDWWVIIPKRGTNEYIVSLIDTNGINETYTRQSGEPWNDKDWVGQAVFSPDGSAYIRANPFNGLHIANFNRCTGEFGNTKKIPLEDIAADAIGVGVSPNSKYIYLSTGFQLFQYELQSSNIAATRLLIGEYDGFLSPFKTTFFQQMLAPDGKIYMTSTNDNNMLHIIHNPNEHGANCNFEQHGLMLPTLHYAMAPNFPHFRLYDLPGSPCDTLGINGPVVSAPEVPVEKEGLRLWPNPASGKVTVALPADEPGQALLTDLTGKVWTEQANTTGASQLDISTAHLPPGVYIVSFRSASGGVASRKLVVQRE